MVVDQNKPLHVIVLPSSENLVADTGNHRILLCPPSSGTKADECTTVAGLGGEGSGASQLKTPGAVAIDGNGDYVIADYDNHRVQLCNATSIGGSCTTVAGTGEKESLDWTLDHPTGIAVVTYHQPELHQI